MESISNDVLVVGGGLAGLRAALEIRKAGRNVAILSKVHPLRSHSVAAQGGINAALANANVPVKDTWERHAFDTIKGADYLAERIRDIARAHDVPLVENKPLAQAFYKLAEPGDTIPVDLYRAVAEVLAYVYRLKGRHTL